MVDLPGGIYLVSAPAEVFKEGYRVAEHLVVSPVVGLLIVSKIPGGMGVEAAPEAGPGGSAQGRIALGVCKADTLSGKRIDIGSNGLWMPSHTMNGIVEVIADDNDNIGRGAPSFFLPINGIKRKLKKEGQYEGGSMEKSHAVLHRSGLFNSK